MKGFARGSGDFASSCLVFADVFRLRLMVPGESRATRTEAAMRRRAGAAGIRTDKRPSVREHLGNLANRLGTGIPPSCRLSRSISAVDERLGDYAQTKNWTLTAPDSSSCHPLFEYQPRDRDIPRSIGTQSP